MNSNKTYLNYKHDILGKFKDIQMAATNLNEDSFFDPSKIEILLAIHHVLIKMVLTSKASLNLHDQCAKLIISDSHPDQDAEMLKINHLILRQKSSENICIYTFYTRENEVEADLALNTLLNLLPIKETIWEKIP